MADFDYDKLDPGIREFVRWLNVTGYKTSDSGDGVSKVGVMGAEDLIDVPHAIVVDGWANSTHGLQEVSTWLWFAMQKVGFNEAQDVHIDFQSSPIDHVETITVWGSALYNWKPPT